MSDSPPSGSQSTTGGLDPLSNPTPAPAPMHFQLAQPAPSEAASNHDSDEFLDRILENYNFMCHPEVRIKFKQQLKNYSIGLALAKPWHPHRSRIRITLKPLEDQSKMAKVLQKVLLVPTHAQVCAFSKKLQFGWLRLQFMAGYNWARKRPTLDYRITTKWSDGGRLKRKEQYQVSDTLLLRCKWNMDLHLPDMEGHLGADELNLERVDVDWGRLDFEISQLDFVLHSPLWRSSPAQAASSNKRGALGGGRGTSGPTDTSQSGSGDDLEQEDHDADARQHQPVRKAWWQRGGSGSKTSSSNPSSSSAASGTGGASGGGAEGCSIEEGSTAQQQGEKGGRARRQRGKEGQKGGCPEEGGDEKAKSEKTKAGARQQQGQSSWSQEVKGAQHAGGASRVGEQQQLQQQGQQQEQQQGGFAGWLESMKAQFARKG